MGLVNISVDDLVISRIEGIKHAFPAIMDEAQLRAGQEIMLPRLRLTSPHVIRDTMIVRSRPGVLSLTTNAVRDHRAIVAYLNWGGTISKPLRPVRARALRFKGGTFSMSVTRGRKNRHPRRFMERTRDEALGAYSRRVGEIIGEELTKRFT